MVWIDQKIENVSGKSFPTGLEKPITLTEHGFRIDSFMSQLT